MIELINDKIYNTRKAQRLCWFCGVSFYITRNGEYICVVKDEHGFKQMSIISEEKMRECIKNISWRKYEKLFGVKFEEA
jgi:hypothetical protein